MNFNEAQAVSEGWALFDVDGRLQLQKDDEQAKFESDADAIIFVALKAHAGSAYHRAALEWIGKLSEVMEDGDERVAEKHRMLR